MLLHDGPLTSQPQEAVEVDWGNPLAAGLQFAVLGNSLTNVVDGELLSSVTPPAVVPTSGGNGHAFTDNTNQAARGKAPPVSDSATLFAVLVTTASSRSGNRCLVGAWGTSQQYLELSYGRLVALTFAGSYESAVSSRQLGSGDDNREHSFGGRFWQGSGRDAWFDGVLDGTSATPATVASFSYSQIGRWSDNGSFLHGTLLLALRWDRALSDDEMRAISANPWQLFRVRQVVLPASAAPAADVAGSVALGLTATGSIAVAKPVSGTVAVALATSGSIAVAKPVAGGVSLALTATGAIAVNKPVAGAVAMGVTCSGALTIPKPVAGSVAVGVTAAGSVAVAKPVAGAVAMALTTSGALTTVGMGGAVAVSVATAGSVAVAKPVSGSVLVSLTTAAALTVAKPVSGAVVLSLTTTGRIETATLRGLVTAVLTLRSTPTTLTLRPTDATLTTRAGSAALTLRPAADAALQFQTDDPV